MEPLNPTTVMFDLNRRYPEEVFEHFNPIAEFYQLMVPLLGIKIAEGPITMLEIEAVLHANYFVSKFLDGAAVVAKVDPAEVKADRHLLACLTALFALKARDHDIYEATVDDCVQRIRQLVNYIVEDNRRSKKDVLEALETVKLEVSKTISGVRQSKIKPFKFLISPPLYAERKNKKQGPLNFFVYHYGGYVKHGLKPAHIRYHDEKYYDTLQVWCTRHKYPFQRLFDSEYGREERRRTKKQVHIDEISDIPDSVIEDWQE